MSLKPGKLRTREGGKSRIESEAEQTSDMEEPKNQ